MRPKHIPALDGLRGIACLMIFTGHFVERNQDSTSPSLFNLFSQSWSGVDLFFVLSGFVIFLSLNSLKEKLRGPALFKSFFVSRAFRILPVYFLFVLSFFYIPFHNRLINSSLFESVVPDYVYLFFGQTVYMIIHQVPLSQYTIVSWSLCAEVFLYILSFLIVFIFPSRHWIKVMVGLILFSWLFRVHIVTAHLNLLAAYFLPICRMDGFMMGGIVSLLYSRDQLKVNQTVLNWSLLVLFTGFMALTVNHFHFLERPSIVFSFLWFSLLYTAILIKVIGSDYEMLSKGPLKHIGVISYFVYLFHPPVLYGVATLNLNVYLNLVLSFGLIVGLASLSWFLMEKPLINRGKAINAKIAVKPFPLASIA